MSGLGLSAWVRACNLCFSEQKTGFPNRQTLEFQCLKMILSFLYIHEFCMEIWLTDLPSNMIKKLSSTFWASSQWSLKPFAGTCTSRGWLCVRVEGYVEVPVDQAYWWRISLLPSLLIRTPWHDLIWMRIHLRIMSTLWTGNMVLSGQLAIYAMLIITTLEIATISPSSR